MITGAHLVLFTSEADGAAGLLPRRSRVSAVDAGGGQLIFALPPGELAADPTEANARCELHLMCDDVHATAAELESKGAKLTQPITDEGFGLVTALAVPGGGDLGLYEPRHPSPLFSRE